MLEIIALIFLTREIGRIAQDKGLRPVTWKIYTIIGWVISETVGVYAGVMIFGRDNLFSVLMIGVTFGITSYFMIRAKLHKLPDYFDDDINRIGEN